MQTTKLTQTHQLSELLLNAVGLAMPLAGERLQHDATAIAKQICRKASGVKMKEAIKARATFELPLIDAVAGGRRPRIFRR